MLTKLTGCRTSTNKTCDIRGGAIFGRQRHNLNKLGRGSQDDATNIISRLWAKNIFFMFLSSSDNGNDNNPLLTGNPVRVVW